MPVHTISKGLDLPIAGGPEQVIDAGTPKCTRVAIVADDYPGMRPRMLVGEGDTVKRGQQLFEDRKNPGVFFTAPGAGRIIGIHRGDKRALKSVVVHLSEAEQAGKLDADSCQRFASFGGKPVAELSRDEVVALLLESGLWTALRRRPFSKVPAVGETPFALFVNAMDTQPLAPNPEVVIEPRREDFERGLQALTRLTTGKTFLCVAAGSALAKGWEKAKVEVHEFRGPHPAGTTGLHVHTLAPVSRQRAVWSIGYQDVLAVGQLFRDGTLDVERVVSLAGPIVKEPRLVRSRLGASLDELLPREELKEVDGKPLGENDYRLISGSVLSGKRGVDHILGFLCRYHTQVSALKEGREREFLGWLAPGADKYSTLPIFISKLLGKKSFDFTTATHGSPRAMVPIGMYERVMPMDILPTFLLRSLLVGDVETAEELGVLELDEEDLALCTFVDPGKTNYGPILRANLDRMEKEG